ncbi:MAG: hypothetical protein AAF696_12530 [Bacteroidota bacterium]
MDNLINWKKGAFSCAFKLFQEGQQIGRLKSKSLGQSAEGEIGGKTYGFNTYGILNKRSEILDGRDGSVLGEIVLNCWGTKADIYIGEKKFQWKFSNAWQSRWKVWNEKGTEIMYKGWTSRGSWHGGNGETEDILQLSGLFIANMLWESAMIAFIPIYVLPLLPIWF